MRTMTGKRIIISPLSWGYGHAGRMIPLAYELKKRGNEVIFGIDNSLIPVVKNELPDITLIPLPCAVIKYSGFLPQYVCIFFQIPGIIIAAFREHHHLRRLAAELKPDIIISDNRFGLFHKKIFSVYVTHQIRIPFPKFIRFLELSAAWLHRKIIEKYDLCLIPDYPGENNLSGKLSHHIRLPANAVYMGPLSRFSDETVAGYDLILHRPYSCLILSGPVSQQALLLEKVREALRGVHLAVLSVTPVTDTAENDPDVTVIINPDTVTMSKVIDGSTMVITRAGYTSIMELVSLGRGAVLIPTPGQTEQEYLAEHHNGCHGFIALRQKNINRLGKIFTGYGEAGVPDFNSAPSLFEDALRMLLVEQKKK
jgi:hypothetical protein